MATQRLKWLLLIGMALIWGSSFILIKKGLLGLDPYQLGSLRIVCASLFMLIVGFRSLPKIPAGKWKFLAMTAMLGIFIPAYLFAIAETRIGSSIAGVLNALTPLNALILGGVFFGLSFQRLQVMGVTIGFIGSLMLVFTGQDMQTTTHFGHVVLIFIATVCYGLNVNIIKKYLSDMDSLTIATGNSAVLLLPSLAILTANGFFGVVHLPVVQQASLFVLLLGVFGTGVANLLFFRLIHLSSTVFATSVAYLIPIVAFFWGLLDKEFLSPMQFVGACVVLVGVWLSGKK
ncbi:DMT family transporter [Flavobacterium caeni]|uniref:EamA-like transporter family protein n=1 Tax=Flavobacterium caeni TaxID=490189 RepID=A0A1G5IM73_9FLAO|nr:DMT family transporter [Flavobacterium caeni]SCY76669.1 EamA-like transporter family protein [Flavobacterium caeni]